MSKAHPDQNVGAGSLVADIYQSLNHKHLSIVATVVGEKAYLELNLAVLKMIFSKSK